MKIAEAVRDRRVGRVGQVMRSLRSSSGGDSGDETRPSVLGHLKSLRYNKQSVWLIRTKLKPFVVRNADLKYISKNEGSILRLKSKFSNKTWEVGCAIFETGQLGIIYCVYGVDM